MRFTYHGTVLDGFDHGYNTTILNERAVELAVAFNWLAEQAGLGLEVGNVLGGYGVVGHRVVDKYDQAPGVDNIDVADITGEYDWIVAISTIEHVGVDEPSQDLDAARRAIDHLASLLTPGGSMLITVPGGYHPTLDHHLATGAGAVIDCTLVRTYMAGAGGHSGAGWKQTAQRTFLPYGSSTKWAESVWIGEW